MFHQVVASSGNLCATLVGGVYLLPTTVAGKLNVNSNPCLDPYGRLSFTNNSTKLEFFFLGSIRYDSMTLLFLSTVYEEIKIIYSGGKTGLR